MGTVTARRLAGLSILVRGLLDEVEQRGGPVIAEFREVLTLVDAAAAGDRPPKRRSAELMGALEAPFMRYGVDSAPLESAVGHLSFGLMQLLSMVQDPEDRTEATLDAANAVLSALHDIGYFERVQRVNELYAAALARTDLPDEPLPPPSPRRTSVVESRAVARSREALPPYARSLIGHIGAARDPKLIGGRRRLADVLGEHRFPVYPAVVEFEQAFGGLLIPESTSPRWRENGEFGLLGAYGCLSTGGDRGGWAASGLVPVGYDAHDNAFVLDADGRPYVVDLVQGGEPRPLGTDGAELVAAVLGFELLEHRGRMVDRPAATLAALLELTLVVDAGPFQLWIGGDTILSTAGGSRAVTLTDGAATRLAASLDG